MVISPANGGMDSRPGQ